MTAVLSVLKIAGIILAALVLLVLLLVLVVLFVPVRFSIDAKIPDTLLEKGCVERIRKESAGTAAFHWLFHAVRGSFRYPGDDSFCVKALWFQLIPQKAEEDNPSGEDLFFAEEAHLPEEQTPEAEKPAETGAASETKKPEDAGNVSEAEKSAETGAAPETKKPEDAGKVPETEKTAEAEQAPVRAQEAGASRKSLRKAESKMADVFSLLPRFFAKVFEILFFVLTKPYEVLWKILYTISSVCDKITDVRVLLDSSVFERAKRVVFKQTVRLLRGIRPKQCDIRILGGTGDPAVTAEILAAFSALYPLFGGTVRMEPDFEQRIAGLQAHLKGRITVFRVLTCAAIVYFNKDVRMAYKKAKRILRK